MFAYNAIATFKIESLLSLFMVWSLLTKYHLEWYSEKLKIFLALLDVMFYYMRVQCGYIFMSLRFSEFEFVASFQLLRPRWIMIPHLNNNHFSICNIPCIGCWFFIRFYADHSVESLGRFLSHSISSHSGFFFYIQCCKLTIDIQIPFIYAFPILLP